MAHRFAAQPATCDISRLWGLLPELTAPLAAGQGEGQRHRSSCSAAARGPPSGEVWVGYVRGGQARRRGRSTYAAVFDGSSKKLPQGHICILASLKAPVGQCGGHVAACALLCYEVQSPRNFEFVTV